MSRSITREHIYDLGDQLREAYATGAVPTDDYIARDAELEALSFRLAAEQAAPLLKRWEDEDTERRKERFSRSYGTYRTASIGLAHVRTSNKCKYKYKY